MQDLHAENHKSLGHHPDPWPADFITRLGDCSVDLGTMASAWVVLARTGRG